MYQVEPTPIEQGQHVSKATPQNGAIGAKSARQALLLPTFAFTRLHSRQGHLP